MDIAKADAMRMFCEEHSAALSRYAFQLTRDQICAENLVHENLAAGRKTSGGRRRHLGIGTGLG